MARKKRASKGSGSGADDEASVASTSTLASLQDLPGAAGEEDFVDPFERCLEALYEKRSSTRVAALSGLVAQMERAYCFEDCMYRHDSMTSMLLSSFRRGGVAEATLAVKALGLHLLTLGLGPELEGHLPDVSLALQKCAAAAGKDVALRSLAAEVLSLLTFAAVEDPLESERIAAGLQTLAASGPEKLAVASLKGWSLLLSALPGWRLDSLFCGDALSQLSPHLSATAVEERAAAGEAIALLFSMSGLSSLEEANDAEGEDAERNGLEDIVSRMKDLATNRGDVNRRSKRDRSFLKTVFRDHYKAVEGSAMRFEKLKMRDGRTIVVDTLEGQVQLKAFRHFLGSGLQPQLEANPLLHDIFGLLEGANGAVHQLTEMGYRADRTLNSDALKVRSKQRRASQSQKAYYAGAVLGAPGDDAYSAYDE